MSIPDWWRSYTCEACGETTRASGLPSYCAACEVWGSMTDA